MLDMVKIDGVDYYDKLAKTEYYAKENDQGEPAGRWGKGAALIGLKEGAEVGGTELRQVMSGYKPSGEKLVQNAGEAGFRVGMDLTFSAPKSLSVVWANSPQELKEEISKFQAEAVASAMEYLRTKTEARRGKGGTIKETPKALIYATFEHCDTRAKDPQLHTHTVTANSCVREDGTTGAIDQEGLYQHKIAAGTIYRQGLGERLRERGFALEVDPKNPEVFQIVGVPADLCKHFSKRSETIKKEAEKTGLTSAAGRRAIASTTRDAKTEINRVELFSKWQEESNQRGFNAQSVEDLLTIKAPEFVLPKFGEMVEKLTENDSFFKVKDIDAMLAGFGQYVDIDREKMKAEFLASPEVQMRGVYSNRSGVEYVYTSRALIEIEQNSIKQAATRRDETAHRLDPLKVAQVVKAYEAAQGFTLRDEQRQAVEHLTTNSGGIALMRGLAGTGKTTALRPTVDAFKASGFEVHGATISAKAAQVLSDETGLNGSTIAQLLLDLDSGKKSFNEKSVLILDEAGMVGSRDFAKLQNHIDKASGKLIAVGDERQLQAISAGGIFEALQHHAELPTADLKTITRQKDADERRAGLMLYEGKAEEALKIYEERGAIVTHKSRDSLISRMSLDYVTDSASTAEKMAITATNAEAVLLNNEIREELKERGEIEKKGVTFTNADGHDIEFSKGDRVLFKQNSKINGVKNNQSGTVLSVEQRGDNARLKIETEDGKIKTIDSREYAHLRHGYAITTHSSQGATVKKGFYLFNRGADLSQGYVGLTRHKDSVKIYATEADRPEMAARFASANFKGTTLDLATVVKLDQPAQVAQATPTPAKAQTAPAVGADGVGRAAVQTATAKIAEKSVGMSFLLNQLSGGSKAEQAAAEGIAISLAGVYERIERDEKSQKETSAKNEQAHKQVRSRGGEEMEL